MKTLNTYMDRAWSDLVNDEDWWKAILALGLMNCVPIIGQIIMFGYLFDWAKEAAWGMQTPLSRKLSDIGRCIKFGFLALWVIILWLAPVVVAGILLSFIPVAGPIICFIVEVSAIFVGMLSAVAAFRSIIYERVMPGLQVKRVFRMFLKDPGGLGQTFSIILLVFPLLVAALFVILLPIIPFMSLISGLTPATLLGTDLIPLALVGMVTIVVALVVWIAGALVSAFISALYIRSLGYWMQDFDPPAWRTPSAPMPFEIEMAKAKEEKRVEKEEAKAALKAEKKAKKADKRQSEAAPEEATAEESSPDASASDEEVVEEPLLEQASPEEAAHEPE